MKNKRIIKILIFGIIVLLISINRSYAAIEIKDTTVAVFTNKTISEFYDMAEEMKNPGQGLEGSNVDVKMANNYEWAIVSYFSNSIYGTSGTGQNTGVQLADSTHLSTNGNITGVMDWGKTTSWTASIIPSYNDDGISTVGGQSIINAAKNTNTSSKIDKLVGSGTGNDYSIAKTNWYNPPRSYVTTNPLNNPYSARFGLFGIWGGGWYYVSEGKAYNDITFRPVFYAQ